MTQFGYTAMCEQTPASQLVTDLGMSQPGAAGGHRPTVRYPGR